MVGYLIYSFYLFIKKNNFYEPKSRISYAVAYFNLLIAINYLNILFIFSILKHRETVLLSLLLLVVVLTWIQYKFSDIKKFT